MWDILVILGAFERAYVTPFGPRAMGQAPEHPPPPWAPTENRPTSEACLFSLGVFLAQIFFFRLEHMSILTPQYAPPVSDGSRGEAFPKFSEPEPEP